MVLPTKLVLCTLYACEQDGAKQLNSVNELVTRRVLLTAISDLSDIPDKHGKEIALLSVPETQIGFPGVSNSPGRGGM